MKKASVHEKKQYVKNGLRARADAVQKARRKMGLTGFVAFGATQWHGREEER